MSYREDVTKIFHQDIREKKSAGTGAFKRKGKGVKHGMRGIRFPSDSLTAAQKRKLSGEVIVVSGLGVKLKIDEFKSHDVQKQKEIMEHWRKLYASRDIQEFLGIDKNVYYKILYDLDIIEKSGTPGKKYERSGKLPNATKEDIISHEEFMSLTIEEKSKFFDEIYNKYNLQSVAEIWGKTLNNLYNQKHYVKQRMEKLNKLSETTSTTLELLKSQNSNTPPIEVTTTNNQASTQSAEVGKDASPNIKQLEIDLREEAKHEVTKQEAAHVSTGDLESLKQMIDEQNKVIQSILSMQQQSLQQPVQQVAATQEVVTETKKSNNMAFSFVDEKEGFLLHQDIKRFIAVLEKNPDLFEVEIKIKRKE